MRPRRPVLIDADWEGQPRKLMLHANRNGFFYVFDRTRRQAAAGETVRPQPDVGERDRRGRASDQDSRTRSRAAPGPRSAPRRTARPTGSRRPTIPATGLYYVQTFEKCSIYTNTEPGDLGGRASRIWAASQRTRARRKPRAHPEGDRHRRPAKIKWELPQPGPAESWGGTLTTATGLVIFGEEGGALMAADAVTGQAAVELPDQPDVEGVADDVHVRRQAVHRRRGRRSNIIAFAIQE